MKNILYLVLMTFSFAAHSEEDSCGAALRGLRLALSTGLKELREAGPKEDPEIWAHRVDRAVKDHIESYLRTQDPGVQQMIEKHFLDLVTLLVKKGIAPDLSSKDIKARPITSADGQSGYLIFRSLAGSAL